MPDGVPHIAISDTHGLTDHVWQLTGGPAPAAGAHLIPLPSGRIGAGWGTGLITWEIADRQLRVMDQAGTARAVFDCAAAAAPALFGSAASGDQACRLDRLRPLPLPVTAEAPPIPGARRNLVILRAGADSLHAAWLHDCPDDARNWDLCLCTYATDVPQTRSEHRFHISGSKFEGLAALLASHDFWLAYDYVWFPDDDLLAHWRDINRLFALCRSHDLALAQPSLQPGSFANHPITLSTDGLLLRFTSFVEIMAPVFSRAALRRAAPTFALNASGYGLDHLWPAMIDAPPNAIAVLDAVSVLHTRPIGASYDQQRAMRDGWAIEDAFHQVNRYEISGAITICPAGHAKRHGVIIADR
ncbi:MAG TPA: hypothetical protein VLI93_12455 [Acetobacteraceae bacterium]|nr:hypothetical protein [Acetobacteraceae bacterium]